MDCIVSIINFLNLIIFMWLHKKDNFVPKKYISKNLGVKEHVSTYPQMVQKNM